MQQIVKLSKSPEEGVHPLYGDTEEGIPGMATVINPLHFPFQIQSTTYTHEKGYSETDPESLYPSGGSRISRWGGT